MKYIVMECHSGYAVLMDEEARFVKAANLRYSVGQTVTEPMLMETAEEKAPSRSITVIRRIAAAAACMALIAGSGLAYYSHNIQPHTTVVIGSDAEISMAVSRSGSVVRVTSDSPEVEDMLKDYDFKGKDTVTVAGELLEMEMSKGIISSGDTVKMYVSTGKSDSYSDYKTQLEDSLPDIDVKISVRDIAEKPAPEAPETPPVPEPGKEKVPAAPVETATKPIPGDEKKPAAETPVKPAAPEPPEVKEDPVTPPAPDHDKNAPSPPGQKTDEKLPAPEKGEETPPAPGGEKAPEPPAPPAGEAEKPQPPAPPEHDAGQDERPVPPSPPAPHEQHPAPEPVPLGEAAPPAPPPIS